MIPASKAQHGELVTTISEQGGVGLGRLFQGTVYRSGGNGWYYPEPGLAGYHRDGGAGYRKALSRLNLPPAYKV